MLKNTSVKAWDLNPHSAESKHQSLNPVLSTARPQHAHNRKNMWDFPQCNSHLKLRLTCGFSMTYLAQLRMSLIASMLVSGKAALHANSDKHLTASWNESNVAPKYFSNTLAEENSGTKSLQ